MSLRDKIVREKNNNSSTFPFSILLLLLVSVSGGCLLSLCLAVVFFRASTAENTPQPIEPPIPHRVVKADNMLKELWSPSDTFVAYEGYNLVAAQGKLFFVGNVGSPENKKFAVLVLDASNGALLWQVNKPEGYSISSPHVSPPFLYVTTVGEASILAYDLNTGQHLWSLDIPWSRGFTHFQIIDNLIYAISDNAFYLIRGDNGEFIGEFDNKPTETNLQALKPQIATFASPESISLDYFEATPLNESIMWMPNNIITDRHTGSELWDMDAVLPARLNSVDTTKTTVYMLTTDGQLLGRELRTGKIITSVQFEPRSFSIMIPGRPAFRHEVAVDKDKGIVYTYLGDSKQLFAFKIVGYSP